MLSMRPMAASYAYSNAPPKWHRVPWRLYVLNSTLPFLEDFANQFGIRVSLAPRSEIMMPRLVHAVQAMQLPYFIINATVYLDDSTYERTGTLTSREFEFYPSALRVRSLRVQSVQYRRCCDSTGISRDLWGSCGCATSQCPAQQEILSAANYDLGFYIDNPLESASLGDQVGLSSRSVPFVSVASAVRAYAIRRASVPHGRRTLREQRRVALLRRGCARTIAIDAEHDPFLDFDAQRRLFNAVRRELDMNVSRVGGVGYESRRLRMTGCLAQCVTAMMQASNGFCRRCRCSWKRSDYET